MTAWTRTDEHGITGTFTYTPDQRGNVTLTVQEVEGLMRAGGWIECDCHNETAWSINSWHGGIEDGIWICDNCGRKKKEAE